MPTEIPQPMNTTKTTMCLQNWNFIKQLIQFTYLYTNGPISCNLGFSPWLRKLSGLVTLKMYTFVSLITPGFCQ